MENKVERSNWLRAFNSLCSTLLIGAAIYIMVIGFSAFAMVAMAISFAGAAAPLVKRDEGIWDIVIGTVEAMVDGVSAIIECISSAIAGLFS